MSVLEPMTQSLELIYIKNVGDSGKVTYETRRFRNLKVDAPTDAVLQVADAIAAISLGEFARHQVTVESTLKQA
ncbi:MAG: DUF1659 domain-containing protein [Clostridium sp.]|jgi:hypothetical protein|nr:DUF1659 domain-containing protein [Clostridium sp.]